MVDVANGHETTASTSRLTVTDRTGQAAGARRPARPYQPDGTPALRGRAATATRCLPAGIRLALGRVFRRPFLDKLFRPGLSTPTANSRLNGGGPTAGFLGKAAATPLVRRDTWLTWSPPGRPDPLPCPTTVYDRRRTT